MGKMELGQADAVVQDGFHNGKPALPRALHLANASRKAQNLLGGNLGLILGRALISLFNLYLCLQLDPLPKHLPAFIRQELLTLCISGHTWEERLSPRCVCPDSNGVQRVTNTTQLQSQELHVHTAIHQLI